MKRWKYHKNYSIKYLRTIKIGDLIVFDNYAPEIIVSIDKSNDIWKVFTDKDRYRFKNDYEDGHKTYLFCSML